MVPVDAELVAVRRGQVEVTALGRLRHSDSLQGVGARHAQGAGAPPPCPARATGHTRCVCGDRRRLRQGGPVRVSASSDAEAVLSISDELEEFQQFVLTMQRAIANTPAGRSRRSIIRIPNFFVMPIRDGDHVEAVARALHPAAFPVTSPARCHGASTA
jgi:hypothetical protein